MKRSLIYAALTVLVAIAIAKMAPAAEYVHITDVIAIGESQFTGQLSNEEDLKAIPGFNQLAVAIDTFFVPEIVGFYLEVNQSAAEGYTLKYLVPGNADQYLSIPADRGTLTVIIKADVPIPAGVKFVNQTHYCQVNNSQFTQFSVNQLVGIVTSNEEWLAVLAEITRMTYAPIGGLNASVKQSGFANVVLSFKPAANALSFAR